MDDVRSLYNQGRLQEAAVRCSAILQRQPTHVEALKTLGAIKIRQQALAEARQIFDQIVTIEPDSADALSNLAYVLLLLNRPDEALAVSERALAVDPAQVGAWVTRAHVLYRGGQLQDALASYDEALKFTGDTEALIGRGQVLAKLGRTEEALATLDRIPVSGNPANLLNRAKLLKDLGLLAAAARDYRQAIQLSPQALPAWMGLLLCALESCDWAAIAEPRDKILTAVDAGQPVSPLLTMMISSDPAQHLKCARAAAARMSAAPSMPAQKPTRPTRLRIAYVSPDFRIHPLAYLIPELLERHDHERFEVIGVSLGPPDGSDIRARIAKSFDQFHDMHTRSDDDVVSLLRRLQIDIAIDLAGCTENARPGIWARRVAPIQTGYLGYCGTSGSDAIDYLLADRIAVPPEQQRFFTEKLVYLPNSFMVADSTQPISDATPSRRECGLPGDGFVFCCFNKNYKLTKPVFDVWMRLLRSVDGSALWLSANLGRAQQNLRRHAEDQAIDPQRIVFAPTVPQRADHFARHRLADLFLDTLPYNAHTTCCDALFAGLPVLTVMGPTFVGRVAASMLYAIGLDELVTQNLEQYEALALDLARNPARMCLIRAKLAANRQTSALFDVDQFRRGIEQAYDRMFEIGVPARNSAQL